MIGTGVEVVKECIPLVVSENVRSVPQNSSGSTYYPIDYIDYRNTRLNVNQTAFQIRNQIRAFSYQLLFGEGRFLTHCDILQQRSIKRPGMIIEETDSFVTISSVDYDVKIYKDV